MTLGIGLCEESGLVMSLLKSCLSDVPPALVPYLIAFVGTIGNIASDTANIIVPPIAALLYIGAGKAPDRWYDLRIRRCKCWLYRKPDGCRY